MAQPPAADAPPSLVDRDVWISCAAPLSRLPAVGSQVYYFPHGHAEQCPAHLPAPLPQPHLFPCTVHAVQLFADAKTDEPYASITLIPGPHRDPPDDASKSNPTPASESDGPQQQQVQVGVPGFCCYAKQLTQSDANNGGGFSVPRSCADAIFPALHFEDDPPVQKLSMRDLLGNQWDFRHIYRGTPRRHLFTTGWTKFVNAKLLVAGDSVVFIRCPDKELIAGVRRTPRYPVSQNNADEAPPRNSRARVPPQEVMDSARDAANGDKFTVTYYPRQGAGEFVVPRKEVEDALNSAWLPGVQVRMQAMDAEERHFEWINGVVKAVDSSIWRMLEIEWDVAELPMKINRHVNPWQVQLVGYPPLLKKLRISGDVAMAESLVGLESQKMVMPLGSHIPAGIQGARRDVPSSSSTVLTTELDLFPQVPLSSSGGSSEIVNPETESPPNSSVNMVSTGFPDEVKSIQLFGTTITSRMQCDINSASAEVNQVPPSAVVDGTANGDASAPSPLDCCASKDALLSESVN